MQDPLSITEQNRDGLEGWNQMWFRAGIRFQVDLSFSDFVLLALAFFSKGVSKLL